MAMKYDIDGHLWWAPTPKLGGGWVAHKDSGSAPTPPDPNVVSDAQTRSNVNTARANATLNRVNQFTPYGNLVYSQQQTPSFDQAGYDKAMAAYNTSLASQASQPTAPPSSPGDAMDAHPGGGLTSQAVAGAPPPPAPTRDQFTNPGSDQWNATISLSPDQQKLLDQDSSMKLQLGAAAQSGLGRATDAMSQPFDTSQMAAYRSAPQGGGAQNFNAPDSNYVTGLNGGNIQKALPNSDYAGQRSNVEDAIYSRVNPQLQRDRNALDVKLSNQGIMPGSEAYNTAVDESDRQANDARMQAVLAGGQEQSRLAGLDLQAGQFANSAQAQDFGQQAANATLNNSVNDTRFNQGMATTNQNNAANQQNFAQQIAASQASNAQRQQQMQEQAYLRSLPLNEFNSLRSGAQVSTPTFSSVPQTNVAGTNTAQNAYNSFTGQQQSYSNQVAGNNQMMGGLYSLGSAYLGSGALGGLGAGAGAAAAGGVGGLGASDLAALAMFA